MYGAGESLKETLTPETWKYVQDFCAKSGLPLEQAKQFKPWLFMLAAATMEFQKIGFTQEGVDFHYFKKAEAAGRKTGALESFEEQLEFLIGMGAGKESEMVEMSLKDLGKIPSLMVDLITAWKTGDVQKIEDLMIKETREKYPALYQSIFVDRNKAWVPKIDEMLKTPEVEFVLVGVGHILGKEGLLEQLTSCGCTVEQIKAAVPVEK